MSLDIKRSWSEQAEENADGIKEKGKSDSRDSSNSHKKPRPNSTSSSTGKPRKLVELETDPSILQRRQKQIDYGKNTVGYHNYIQHVPLDQRKKEDPQTPDKYTKYSRRSWDTLIKMWRKKLHEYDTEGKKEVNTEYSESDASSN